ncbi:ClpP/crotonase-like domain-containing protein [Thelonectria olida]|uniref:ClpP/crotonase-like domain-containing protein n=1 Tax=Thelonectria olida TaxID=1576542 RepID=A0A9P8WDD2_9HYPO|nr:ClpP/crotonase-like domain-containing protein [Thelonectria olida]
MPKLYHSHSGPHFFTLTVTTFPNSLIMSQTFSRPPPEVPGVLLSSPRPHVLLVTLNRPKQLNALRRHMHFALAELWSWYDAEPGLRCAVITGAGRAFCAGADLKEWHDKNNEHELTQGVSGGEMWADDGFGGLSNRRGKKPVIAAVNGLCLGGGFEMALNVDMVIAAETAKFGLPEVTRGVVAIAGALPRIVRTVGRQRASEMALLGRTYTATQLEAWGLVNKVVESTGSAGKPAQEEVNAGVVEEALRWAAEMAGNSPDAVIVSREGLLGGWEAEDPRASTQRVDGGIYRAMDGGENMKEGVLSFVEKRKAVWRDSKL